MTWVTGIGLLCALGSDAVQVSRALRAGTSGIAARDDGYLAALPAPDVAAALTADRPGPLAGPDRALRLTRRAPAPVQAAVIAACQAWRDAGLCDGGVPPDKTGLVVAGSNLTAGAAGVQLEAFNRDPRLVSPRHALQMWDTDLVGTISEVLGITGEGHTVGAASASGAVAIVSAARLLAVGALDACLVVGVAPALTAVERAALRNIGATAAAAPEPPGSPFDSRHRGFVPGEGAACLVLETGARPGARCQAELAGYSVALDGSSLAAPTVDGEVRAMSKALSAAGISPGELDYISPHGTGSVLGDATELAALRRVLGSAWNKPWLNATKALTGHCLTAAGVVEAAVTVLQMREGFIHPSPGLLDPVEPGWRFTGPAAVPARIRTALSASYGFGGFNAAIAFREAT